MIDAEQAIEQFARTFSGRCDLLVTSPGRVNLIGEHVDYNSGLVMPMAIGRGTTLAARARDDTRVSLYACAFEQADRFDLADVERPGEHGWSNYVRGVAALLGRHGVAVGGADLLIASDLPVGGGLSSSASLEVGAALAFLTLADARMEPLELALLCQKAEHEYAGVPCGLMDQYAVVFGQAGHAVRLDCRDFEHELVPADHEAIGWLIIDTRAPRNLGESGYRRRRTECDRALGLLRKLDADLQSLRDVSLEMLESARGRLGELLTRRVRHVVTEIARVREGSSYLAHGRYDLFGRLMYSSHHSLADDYEVSIDALDHIVRSAADTLGVYGCRLTGGGFGGCAIALVAAEAAGFFAERVSASHSARFGRQPGILLVRPADSARAEKV